MHKPLLRDFTTSKNMGQVFGMIADTKKWDSIDFCRKWLDCPLAEAISEYDPIIGRGKYCIYEDIIDHLDKRVKPSDSPMPKSALEWFGYLTTFWTYTEEIKPKELLKYDTELILEEYDILHTYSVKGAIEDIKENLEMH